MTQIEVSFSAFLTIFVHFWPILAQFFDLYCTKIMSWAFFGTKVTPLAILHTPKSCLVALKCLKRAKNWLKLMLHFPHFLPFSFIFGPFCLNFFYSYYTQILSWSFYGTSWTKDTLGPLICPKSSLVAFKRP